MSQEDRPSGGPLREEFVFLEQQQRSCRCAGVPGAGNPPAALQSQEHASQSSLELPEGDGFVVEVEDQPDSQHEQHRHQEIGFERFSGLRTSAAELQSALTGVNFVEGDDRFVHGSQKIAGRCNANKYSGNGEPDDDGEVEADALTEMNPDQHPVGLGQIHSRKDLYEEETSRDRSPIDPAGPLADRGSSPVARNDERPSTAASSVSFATSLSSNENNPRTHGRAEAHEGHNRSQSNVHHQLPIINAFNNSRSNLRLTRENNRANVDATGDAEEIHRVPPNAGNVGTYNPGFHGIHNEHILQPIHRQASVGPKGTFDTIQVSASNTLEKGKCQCHHIQQHQHQHQQRLPSIQQREQIHTHHHHQHRHKSMQQQQQQPRSQSQQQQQQHYRHHHYHHPHQHIGQQQDLQRQQNDQLVGRNKHGGAGPEDDSGEMIEPGLGTHQPPALPPRPPPRPSRRYEQNAIAAYDLGPNNGEDAGCCKKYVVLCCLCGGLSAAVGSLFLAVHAVLSAHTASLALFETVPSYIPGTMLILMGLFTILLARRKHRYGFLMKMCGSIGVVCALVCVLVTVTTTVVHMSRLQGLRECIYTEIAKSCTCYGVHQGKPTDPGVLFEGTPHCEVVHGALYDCLRALFGVSVAGILACIFSCMLLYQLLSHEKKKMYWEQLQLRCRSLYGQGGSGAAAGTAGGSCGCCNDCGGASPWWARTPGNLYTPNPDLAPFSRRWRLPWSRSRGPAPTPDSNYGFHTQSRGAVVMRSSGSSADAGDNTPGPYSVLTDDSQTGAAPYSLMNGSGNAPYAPCTSSVASYSLLENGPLPALWDPPPPYSDPNSPARRPQLTDDRRPPTSARPPPPTAPSSTPVNVSTNRIGNKRTIDNFETGSCEEYRQRGTPKRPSDNYENAEEVLSADPDLEMGNLHQHHPHHHHPQHQQDDDNVKGRRLRKSLKGVENSGFQQESGNGLSKQSESELYFGDVSSCCGPESSFYDLALEKEQQPGPDPGESLLEYPTPSRLGKQRQPSKRSRLPLPLPALNSESSVVSLTDNYTALSNPVGVEEVGRNASTRGPYLAPDAQYEVIAQQTRYTYYNPKSGEHVLEIPLPSLASLAYRNSSKDQLDDIDRTNVGDYHNDCQRVAEHCTVDGASSSTTVAPSPSPPATSLPPSPVSHSSSAAQRCPNDPGGSAIRETTWQPDQTRSQSGEGVCPVNV